MKYVGKVVDIHRNKVAIKAFTEGDDRPTIFVVPVEMKYARDLMRNDLVRFVLENNECTWIKVIDL